MNIVIVTHYFPPLNEIASLRLYAFAKYLAQDGNNIHIVTSKKSVADGDLSLSKELPTNVSVHSVDYKSLSELYSKVKGKKKQVNMNASIGEPGKKNDWKSKLKSTVANEVYSLGSLLDFQIFWRKPATKLTGKIIREHKIDVVITSFSPLSTMIIGARIKKQFKQVKWVADYRDLCSLNNVSAAKGKLNLLERRVELNTVGKYSDLITVVSEPLKESLQVLFPQKKIITIENGFDEDDYPAKSKEKQIDTNTVLKIIHSGTIYPGTRDPSPLFIALNQLEQENVIDYLSVRVIFYGNKLGDLDRIIEQCNAGNWVEKGGQIGHTQSLQMQRESDILLLLEGDNTKSKGVLTGKLFEYLMSGTPIFGVGLTKETSAGQLIIESNTGFALGNDVEKIKKALKMVLQDRNCSFYVPDFDIINKYSRRLLTKKLLNSVNELFR